MILLKSNSRRGNKPLRTHATKVGIFDKLVSLCPIGPIASLDSMFEGNLELVDCPKCLAIIKRNMEIQSDTQ